MFHLRINKTSIIKINIYLEHRVFQNLYSRTFSYGFASTFQRHPLLFKAIAQRYAAFARQKAEHNFFSHEKDANIQWITAKCQLYKQNYSFERCTYHTLRESTLAKFGKTKVLVKMSRDTWASRFIKFRFNPGYDGRILKQSESELQKLNEIRIECYIDKLIKAYSPPSQSISINVLVDDQTHDPISLAINTVFLCLFLNGSIKEPLACIQAYFGNGEPYCFSQRHVSEKYLDLLLLTNGTDISHLQLNGSESSYDDINKAISDTIFFLQPLLKSFQDPKQTNISSRDQCSKNCTTTPSKVLRVYKNKKPDFKSIVGNVLSNIHGSSLLEYPQTSFISTVTLAAATRTLNKMKFTPSIYEGFQLNQKENISKESNIIFSINVSDHVSQLHITPIVAPNKNFIFEHSTTRLKDKSFSLELNKFAENALFPVMPSVEEFPYSIRVTTEAIGEEEGINSIFGASVALMSAGVPIKRAVFVVSAIEDISWKIVDQTEEILLEPNNPKNNQHLFSFVIAGTSEGITAISFQKMLHKDGITVNDFTKIIKVAHKKHIDWALKFNDSTFRRDSSTAPKIKKIEFDQLSLPHLNRHVVATSKRNSNFKFSLISPSAGLLIAPNNEILSEAYDLLGLTYSLKVGEIYIGKIVALHQKNFVVELFSSKLAIVPNNSNQPVRYVAKEMIWKTVRVRCIEVNGPHEYAKAEIIDY